MLSKELLPKNINNYQKNNIHRNIVHNIIYYTILPYLIYHIMVLQLSCDKNKADHVGSYVVFTIFRNSLYNIIYCF